MPHRADPPTSHADELKSSGLKATLPRIKVLEVFQRTSQRHMTAEDVFKALLMEGAIQPGKVKTPPVPQDLWDKVKDFAKRLLP